MAPTVRAARAARPAHAPGRPAAGHDLYGLLPEVCAGGGEAGGVAGDHQLLIRRHDHGHRRAVRADAPPCVAAVPGVGSGVFGQAEETQPGQDLAADQGAVLADAGGENQRVEPLQAGHHPGDRLGQPVHEDLQGEPCRLLPSAAAASTVRMSLLTPDSPCSPLTLYRAWSSSSMVSPARSARKAKTPGSTSPERVPMTSPSSGVSPIVVSTDAPSRTAARLHPVPRWAMTRRSPASGRPSRAAARSLTKR